MRNFFFRILVLLFVFGFVNLSGQNDFAAQKWNAFNISFKIPSSVNVTTNSNEAFIASNYEYNISLYPKNGGFPNNFEKQRLLDEWVKSNNVTLNTESTSGTTENGFNYIKVIGTKDNSVVTILTLSDSQKPETAFYAWISINSKMVDQAMVIVNSFKAENPSNSAVLNSNLNYISPTSKTETAELYTYRAYSWTDNHLTFQIPENFNVEDGNAKKFKASNSKIEMSIVSRKETLSNDADRQVALQKWAVENKVEISDQVVFGNMYGLVTISIEGEKDGKMVSLMILHNPQFPDTNMYVWLSYQSLMKDAVAKITRSFFII
jgi:hypothetical protein